MELFELEQLEQERQVSQLFIRLVPMVLLVDFITLGLVEEQQLWLGQQEQELEP